MMERLIAVSQDAVFKLEAEPASTVDFVNLLKSAKNILCTSYLCFTYAHVHVYTCTRVYLGGGGMGGGHLPP